VHRTRAEEGGQVEAQVGENALHDLLHLLLGLLLHVQRVQQLGKLNCTHRQQERQPTQEQIYLAGAGDGELHIAEIGGASASWGSSRPQRTYSSKRPCGEENHTVPARSDTAEQSQGPCQSTPECHGLPPHAPAKRSCSKVRRLAHGMELTRQSPSSCPNRQ
jgi:hypothetical protein